MQTESPESPVLAGQCRCAHSKGCGCTQLATLEQRDVSEKKRESTKRELELSI